MPQVKYQVEYRSKDPKEKWIAEMWIEVPERNPRRLGYLEAMIKADSNATKIDACLTRITREDEIPATSEP